MSESQFPSEIVTHVRQMANIASDVGPTDESIEAGIRGFVDAFDYWYARVVRETVPQYRNKIVARINPFIRRIEFDSMDSIMAAERLVNDWSNRNFVTAGGWAIEALAIDSNPNVEKSSAEGIDLERIDPTTGARHLYVLKSGPVTRNSDIVKALKTNAAKAEKLLQQSGRSRNLQIVKNYAIASGKTSSTFEDGVRRPSSEELWSELLNVEEDQAVELVLAMAAVAGPLVRQDAEPHLQAMKLLVGVYISDAEGQVDWDFVGDRTFRQKKVWQTEDSRRHELAVQEVRATGYDL